MSAVHHDKRWPPLRLAAKRRDGWRCVRCGGRLRLEVAHIISAKARPDLAFELTNVRTLDWKCHAQETRAERGGDANPAREAWNGLVNELSKPSNRKDVINA